MNVLNSFRSEWILLNRRRMWLTTVTVIIAFTVIATALSLAAVKPASRSGSVGLVLESVTGSGGATAAVIFSMSFASIVVVAAFASTTGNEFSRGTLRAALTRQPSRSALIAGQLGARVGVAAVLALIALIVGVITAAAVAPGQHISTTDWYGGAAVVDGLANYARLMGYLVMYALIGTTIAVLVRSTPIALAIGLLWFGPIENVLGEDRAWAERWFPGLVLRSLLQPDARDAISTGSAIATLALYAAVGVAVIAVVLNRRDVTA